MIKKILLFLTISVSLVFAEMVRYDNGIVEDKSTGLMWQDHYKPSVPRNTTWTGAIYQCDILTLGGYDDWRLPNYNELMSIMDFSRGNDEPLINRAFLNVRTKESKYENNYNNVYYPRFYWTSTTFAPNDQHAWVIYFFNHDNKEYTSRKTNNTRSANYRCVRGEPN